MTSLISKTLFWDKPFACFFKRKSRISPPANFINPFMLEYRQKMNPQNGWIFIIGWFSQTGNISPQPFFSMCAEGGNFLFLQLKLTACQRCFDFSSNILRGFFSADFHGFSFALMYHEYPPGVSLAFNLLPNVDSHSFPSTFPWNNPRAGTRNVLFSRTRLARG